MKIEVRPNPDSEGKRDEFEINYDDLYCYLSSTVSRKALNNFALKILNLLAGKGRKASISGDDVEVMQDR